MATPELFVLGDSISMHYGPWLKQFITPQFNYSRKGEGLAAGDLNFTSTVNGGDSKACLAYLTSLLEQGVKIDLLLWNCGLHDVKTTAAGHQVELASYIENLEAAIALLRRYQVKLIWLRTTAAFEDIHNARCKDFSRFHHDVIEYNAAADRVMTAAGVPLIDLYGFTLKFGNEAYCDHVHFHEEIRKLQAAFIAGHILGNQDRWA